MVERPQFECFNFKFWFLRSEFLFLKSKFGYKGQNWSQFRSSSVKIFFKGQNMSQFRLPKVKIWFQGQSVSVVSDKSIIAIIANVELNLNRIQLSGIQYPLELGCNQLLKSTYLENSHCWWSRDHSISNEPIINWCRLYTLRSGHGRQCVCVCVWVCKFFFFFFIFDYFCWFPWPPSEPVTFSPAVGVFLSISTVSFIFFLVFFLFLFFCVWIYFRLFRLCFGQLQRRRRSLMIGTTF